MKKIFSRGHALTLAAIMLISAMLTGMTVTVSAASATADEVNALRTAIEKAKIVLDGCATYTFQGDLSHYDDDLEDTIKEYEGYVTRYDNGESFESANIVNCTNLLVNFYTNNFKGKISYNYKQNGGSAPDSTSTEEYYRFDADLNITADVSGRTAIPADGYQFTGWSVYEHAIAGTTSTITVSAGTKLYAQYRKPAQAATFKYYNVSNNVISYTVDGYLYNKDTEATYSFMIGLTGPNPKDNPIVNEKIYTFLGWRDDARAEPEIYDDQTSSFKCAEGPTFYAVYRSTPVYNATVSFNTNGGSAVASLTGYDYINADGTRNDTLIVLEEEPTKQGSSFLGWCAYDNMSCVEYQTGDMLNIVSNKTLYAVWECIHSESGVCTNCGGVLINQNNFPDANFRAFLADKSYGADGFLTAAEIAEVTTMQIESSAGITSLAGIEYFTDLQELNLFRTNISELNVSQNKKLAELSITYSPITSLDLTQNPALVDLYCVYSELKTLNVSNTPIEVIQVYNNKLETLNISGCTKIRSLKCQDNLLTSLDVSAATALDTLNCRNNRISELDISNNDKLTYLNISINPISSVSVSHLKELYYLSIGNTDISVIDVRENTKLTDLCIYGTDISSVDLSQNELLDVLEMWDCPNIESIDISCNPRLLYIDISDTKISSLDLSGKTLLKYLYARNVTMTSLDLSDCTELVYLYTNGSAITSLDLTVNTKLTRAELQNSQLAELKLPVNGVLANLFCSNTKLTALDTSQCTSLTYIDLTGSPIRSLDLSANSALSALDISNTQITSLKLPADATMTGLVADNLRQQADLSGTTLDMSVFGDTAQMTILSGGTLNEGILTLEEDTPEVVYIYNTGILHREITVTLYDPNLYTTAFENISVSLGEDITVKYYTVQSNFENPQIRFTVNGYTKTVSGTLVGAQFKFVFDGIAPQWIGDTITAELIIDGEVKETKEYSVLRYLNNLKSMTATELNISEDKYNKMQTLINDLLIYGSAAQSYVGHNTDNLVSDGVTGTEYVDIESSDKVLNNGENVKFKSATVYYDSTNALKLTFSAVDLEGVEFKLKINNGTESQVGFINNQNGTYTIVTDSIYAYSFDDVYTVTAYKNGETLASLSYSVKSYVFSKQGGTGEMAELAKATYNYGRAAKAYKEAQ